MANISFKTARKKSKVDFRLPSTHVTTLDVGQLRPTNIVITSPGDTFDVDFNQQSMLSPLLVPSFGSFALKTFAFFVPCRTVWDSFEDFMTNTVDSSLGAQISRPRFTLADVINLFFNTSTPDPSVNNHNTQLIERVAYIPDATATGAAAVISQQNWDISVSRWTSTNTEGIGFYRFTSKGRWFMNIFRSLGYEFPNAYYIGDWTSKTSLFGVESINYDTFYSSEYFNGLPILSFAKCLYDWVYPSAYVQQLQIGYLFHSVEQVYSWQWLSDCMKLIFVQYEQDFFTSLWQQPQSVSSSSGAFSLPSHLDVYNSNVSLSVNSYRNSVTVEQRNGDGSQPNPSSSLVFTSSALRFLQSMSDFVIRNNIGGTRFREWMKAHFGFVTQEQDAHRSIFIKSWNHEVQISDVKNTSMTSASLQGIGVLGEKAGEGWSRGSGHMKFEAKEHGFIIFMSMVVPHTGYYQGLAPWCRDMLSSRFNFFTPEWENLGLEAIPRKSVFNNQDLLNTGSVPLSRGNEVFGFGPRYAEMYKIGHDYLTGDFRFRTRNTGLEAYHTFRDVLYGRSNLALDAQFLQVDNQYDRIFAYVNAPDSDPNSVNNTDKFFSIFQFNVVRHAYMESVGESMPLFDKSGDSSTVNYQGSQLK